MFQSAEPSLPDGFRPEPLSGTHRHLFGGKYHLIGQIGKGGMADVFLGAAAGPMGVSKPVVIKKMQDAARDDPAWARMFLDEARLAARLNHPNVIHTYDVGEESGALFLAMEYLEGKTLGHLANALAKRQSLVDVGMACHLVVELLEGLDYAHDLGDFDGSPLGIVHRDVSPHNVFITFDGHVKVLDFGIAKTASGESQTERGVLKGKARYMAPEQASGADVDRRADLFAAGVLLWELLTGERLYKGETTEVLLRIVSEDAPLVSSRRPDIDPELDAIVAGALARKADARFPTAAKMANALTSFLARRGLAVRAGDVVSLLQSLFPGAREESRRRVDAWMEGQRGNSTPELGGLTEGGARISTSNIRPIQGRSSGRVLFGLGLVAIVGVLGATGFVLGRRNAKVAAPAPSVSVAAIPAPREETVGAESFHLALNSSPVESTIEWSGKPLGQTPLMVDLDPGPQVFVLKREGFHPATVLVNVTERMSGKTESRTVMMVPVDKDDKGAGHVPSAQSAPQAKVITTAGTTPGVAIRRVSLAAVAPVESPANVAPPTAPVADAVPAAVTPPPAETAAVPDVAPTPLAVAPPAIAAVSAPAAAPSPSPGAPLRFGPDMSEPKLLYSVPPVYPREAQVAGIEGMVIAKCTITTTGSVESCRIIRGLPFMDKPILDALAQRKYTPVIYKGSPVAVQYVLNTRIVRP